MHAVRYTSNFFFLMNRRPRRPTLFPYTTLFRSGKGGFKLSLNVLHPRNDYRWIVQGGRFQVLSADEGRRSEEHTSELQSLTNLVCRLLLEKKKKSLTNPPTWRTTARPGRWTWNT